MSVLYAFLAAQAGAAPVAEPAVSEPVAIVEPAPTVLRLPALTNVRIRVLADLASKENVTGDEFDIALAEPIALPGGYIVPAGTKGRGWVIHADKARFGGKPGELLLGARYLELGETRIALRSMKVSVPGGKDNGGLATGMAVAGGAIGGVASMFITGGQQRVASGVEAVAKTSADIDLPIALLARDERAPVPVQATLAPAVAPVPATITNTNSPTGE